MRMKRQDRDYGISLRKRRVWFAETDDGAEVETDPENVTRTTPTPDKPSGDGDMFPRDYVEELRQENAGWRTKLRETEKSMGELQKKLDSFEAERNELQDKQKAGDEGWQKVAEDRLEELKDLKSQHKAALAQMQLEITRANVAAKYGLNIVIDEETGETIASRLRGDTPEEIDADAQKLARLFKAKVTQTEGDPPTPDDKKGDKDKRDNEKPTDVERRRHTTAAPGGPPMGRTDADRKAQFFGSSPSDSPMFRDIDVIMPPGNEG